MAKTIEKRGPYRYKTTRLGESSAKYGPCEVCKKYADELYLQVESMRFQGGITYHGCRTYFGHLECLKTERRA